MNNEKLSRLNRISRFAYLGLISIFLLLVVLQFLFAGMAIFISPVNWMKHTTLIHLFGFNIPVLLLIFAYLGKLPRLAYWNIFGLLVSVFAMYFTANMTSVFSWVGALHPVMAIILLIVSYHAFLRTRRLVFIKQKGGK